MSWPAMTPAMARFFRAHRDNTTAGSAHRRFACTINLNAEDYDGGELRFPEFGPQTYRAPTGGAVVFSCSLLHEATPVRRGNRYAFLPFFYNEPAAKIRQQNSHALTGTIVDRNRGENELELEGAEQAGTTWIHRVRPVSPFRNSPGRKTAPAAARC